MVGLRLRIGLGISTLVVLAGCAGVAGTAVPGATPVTSAPTTSETTRATDTSSTRTSATRTSPSARTTEASTPAEDSVVTSAPASDDPPQNLAVGESVDVTVYDGAGTVTLVAVERKAAGADEYADAPTQGNYVLLDVSYEATEGELNYNLFDWTIRDSEGRRYDASGSYDGYEPGLSSGTLSKGNKARGLVVIDAPAGPLTAEYTPSSIAPASWVIPG